MPGAPRGVDGCLFAIGLTNSGAVWAVSAQFGRKNEQFGALFYAQRAEATPNLRHAGACARPTCATTALAQTCATPALAQTDAPRRRLPKPAPHAGAAHGSSELLRCRCRFRSPRRRFSSSRRRCEASVGRVGRLLRSTFSPAARRARSRSRASCRFWAWERRSPADAVTVGPSRSRRRCRAQPRRLADAAISKATSALVLDVLACWPPGPPAGENRQSSSSSRISTPGATRRTSPRPCSGASLSSVTDHPSC